MSGHSKWAQIKHKKEASDQERGRIFSKLSRAISVAARQDPDQSTNARLRAAIEKAREANMPSERIERAIKKTSDLNASQLQELRIEIVAPGGTAMIVSAITDNGNRTLSEIKHLVSEFGARLAETGSIGWMFQRVGQAISPRSPIVPSDTDIEPARKLVDALNNHDDVQDVVTNVSVLNQ